VSVSIQQSMLSGNRSLDTDELVYRMISVSPVGCMFASLTRVASIAETLMLLSGWFFVKTFGA